MAAVIGPQAAPPLEDPVLKKIQDQDGIISLLQTQIEFQAELISKHDKLFTDLVSKVEELAGKVKTLEEVTNGGGTKPSDFEAATSALWSNKENKEQDTKSLADMVKETAEQTLGVESGFVFDDKLGLYFDQASGYYYDPVKQLYYNGHTKTFYSYDATTGTYQVHSTNSVKRKKKAKVKRQVKHPNTNASDTTTTPAVIVGVPSPTRSDPPVNNEDSLEGSVQSASSPLSKAQSDMEEGEISSSGATSAESSPRSKTSEESCEEEEERQTSYPPCIRAVVQEGVTGCSDFKKGSLFVVPFTGGSIGSSGAQHAILLPVDSVEENHAKIHYEDAGKEEETEDSPGEQGKYFITDLGSEQGTFLNRVRLSESGETSEPHELVHGSTLQIGDVVLLIHIHPGDFTCGHCEPGLLLQKEPIYEYTAKSNESVRRSEMKKIKKKYGLDKKKPNAAGTPTSTTTASSEVKYVDRAKNRRVQVGSDNPFAKTEVASTKTPIRETNKGFKMLQKMGWKGEGLGSSNNQGITEPINCEVKTDRGGLGSDLSSSTTPSGKPPQSTSKEQKRLANLAKTMERFNEAAASPK